MTDYAVLQTGRTLGLVGVWSDGVRRMAEMLAEGIPAHRSAELHALASSLEGVSQELWSRYEVQELDVDEASKGVAEQLVNPGLPGGQANALESCDALLEHAACLARGLRALDLPPLTHALQAEIAHELEAVGRAMLGDLSGRAAQAVTMERLDASPTQVAVVHQLLRQYALSADPGAHERAASLLQGIEPAAAATAVAAWCVAIARFYGQVSGEDPVSVAAEADGMSSIDGSIAHWLLEAVIVDEYPLVLTVRDLVVHHGASEVAASLVETYLLRFELVKKEVGSGGDGPVPTVFGTPLPHPDSLAWPDVQPDIGDPGFDEYHDARTRAIRAELGRHIAALVQE